MTPPVIILSAGEVSGDKLAADLARNLRRSIPSCDLFGIGGDNMRAAGVKIIADYRALAVMGYWEAIKNLPSILRVRRRLLQHIKKTSPALFIGVDAPDFNLSVARRARQYGAKTVQYVAPSVWMWRRRRLAHIRRVVDAVWCLLPFEKPVYAAAGVDAAFVGHPAATRSLPDRMATRARWQIAADERVVLLLPGTRRGELQRHLPLLAAVQEKLTAPKRRFITAGGADVVALLRRWLPSATVLPFDEALAVADVAVVKSGTATLETALAGVPMVVVYRLSGIAHWLVRWHTFALPYFSLPNILCRRFVVPELLLDEAVPEIVTANTERLLTDEALCQRMRDAFATIQDSLLQTDKTAAAAAAELLQGGG